MPAVPLSTDLRGDQRAALALGFGALAAGVVALGWELLAHQAPYTPAAIPTLVAPVAQLRSTCFATGTLALALGPALPLVAEAELPRWWVRGAVTAAVAMLAVLAACAVANVTALQLYDPQPRARVFVYARLVTQGLAAAFLLDLARRALIRMRPS